MIDLIDESLEEFLRTEVPLSRDAVEIAFEVPDKEWGSAVTQPTLNLFLWDVRRSAEESESGLEQVVVDGATRWRERPPRFEFRYLVTAWATEVLDEHRLLGAILPVLVSTKSLPARYLRPMMAGTRPLPTLKTGIPEAKDLSDLYAAIEGRYKAGLDLIVTATVDPAVLRAAGPPTEEIGYRVADKDEPARVSTTRRVGGRVADPAAVGAVVHSPRGSGIVLDDGTFLIPAEPGDEVVVETPEPMRATVPFNGHVVFD